jgi:hypothetical protein
VVSIVPFPPSYSERIALLLHSISHHHQPIYPAAGHRNHTIILLPLLEPCTVLHRLWAHPPTRRKVTRKIFPALHRAAAERFFFLRTPAFFTILLTTHPANILSARQRRTTQLTAHAH